MSGQIDERYASPGLRWGLLLEDHPTATYGFELQTGVELGIPEGWGEDDEYCVATIEIPGHEPVSAFKPLRGVNKDPDQWNLACTKALGRALKRAGYPDHMPDLKAIVLWRQRRVELQRLAAGEGPVAAIGPGEADQIMEEATVPARERSGKDFDEPVDAEIVEEDAAAEATAGDDAPDKVADLTWSDATVKRETAEELLEGISAAHMQGDEGLVFVNLVTEGRTGNLQTLTEAEGQRARLLLTMLQSQRLEIDFKAETFLDSKGRNVLPVWAGACSLVEMKPVRTEADLSWGERARDAGVTPASALRAARSIAAEQGIDQPQTIEEVGDDEELAAAFTGWLDQQRKKTA